jgi:hypothetical protein
MGQNDSGWPFGARPLHRNVERSSVKGLGDRKLQGNCSFVALKLSIPQAIRTQLKFTLPSDYTSGAPRFARTTTVPAILSCQA